MKQLLHILETFPKPSIMSAEAPAAEAITRKLPQESSYGPFWASQPTLFQFLFSG